VQRPVTPFVHGGRRRLAYAASGSSASTRGRARDGWFGGPGRLCLPMRSMVSGRDRGRPSGDEILRPSAWCSHPDCRPPAACTRPPPRLTTRSARGPDAHPVIGRSVPPARPPHLGFSLAWVEQICQSLPIPVVGLGLAIRGSAVQVAAPPDGHPTGHDPSPSYTPHRRRLAGARGRPARWGAHRACPGHL
jgi:hypothetical protein